MGALSRRSFDSLLRDVLTTTQPGIGAYWQVILSHGSSFADREFLVAVSRSDVVGLADLRMPGDGSSFLSHICVSSDVQGRGVATSLLTEHLARHPQVSRMELDVFADNTAAARLYARLGFEPRTATHWFTRPVEPSPPTSAEPALELDDLHDSCAWFDAYGFCELRGRLDGEPFHVGRVGEHTLRLFAPEDASNRRLISRLCAYFPEVRRLLLIVPEHHEVDASGYTLFNRSVRMVADDARRTVVVA